MKLAHWPSMFENAYTFFPKLKNTRFLRFLEMTCQKIVENVIKVSE